MILRANCKINLGLDILRCRADGFHDLETVMFPVADLYDEVEVVRTGASGSVYEATGTPGAAFRAEGLAVDCAPEENICLKAFRLSSGITAWTACRSASTSVCRSARGWAGDRQTVRLC